MTTQTAVSAPAPDRNAMIFILVTAFLNFAGIGLIGPVSPFLLGLYITSPQELAFANSLLFTSYSLFQFLAVPGLGALSDRYGRRPLMLICLFGSAIGYLMFGIGGALWMLFLGRIIDGITGGNLGVIYAYIADITAPQDRTRYYGLIGAVSGLGFIVGPVLGGIFSGIGGPTAPVYFAAAVTLVNVVWGYFAMPESLSPEKRTTSIRIVQLNPFGQLVGIFKIPQLRGLLIAVFFVVVPFAALQANLSVLTKDWLNWTASEVSLLFSLVGIVGVIVQGGLIRRLVPRFGEIKLTIAGAVLMIAGFLLMALVPGTQSAALAMIATAVFAAGNGLATPSLTSLVSQTVSPREQGRIQGGNQSVQAMGRVLGPLWGGYMYVQIGAPSPYWAGAIMFVVALIAVFASIPVILRAKAEREALMVDSTYS